MTESVRFKKPSMTNLPKELGISIFRQIMNSPAPDREKMRAESRRLTEENMKVRKKEIAEGNTSK